MRRSGVDGQVYGGCHLTRPVVGMLTAAGYRIAAVDSFYEAGQPKPFGAFPLGTAVPA